MDPITALLALPQFARWAVYIPIAIAVAAAVQAALGATAGVPTTASPKAYRIAYQVISAIANLKTPATILPPAIAVHRQQQDAALDVGLPLPPAPPANTITLPVPKPTK
jgi:hypothetical protein